MDRADVIEELNKIFLICRFNGCGATCEHEPELRRLGELLEKDTILYRKKKYGCLTNIEIAEKGRPKNIEMISKDEVLELIAKGLTQQEIINTLKVGNSTYFSFVKRHKIVNPNKNIPNIKGITLKTIEKDIENGLNTNQIIKKYKFKTETYRYFRKKNNIINKNDK